MFVYFISLVFYWATLVAWSCPTLWLHGLQHARLPGPSPFPGVSPNSCPLSRWGHPTISSSVIPFSFCLQSFPAPGSFLMSQFFSSDGQSIGASAWASMLPMNIQDWFPLELTDLIFLQSKTLKSFPTSSILRCSAFFMVQFSHPYVTTRKTISTLITF